MVSLVEPPLGRIGTIDQVLDALDVVVARAIDTGDRVGYFASIYRAVTAKVAEGIQAGFFDDGPRMAQLDVRFATRYLTALDEHQRGARPTASWRAAFDACTTTRPLVLQHLLAGINAHINLDLGVAAAETAPGAALPALRADFDRINEILGVMVDNIKDQLGDASPWIRILDHVGGRGDDEIVKFSMEVARTEAWRFATELAPIDREHWGGPIGARDTRVTRLANLVLHPGLLSIPLAIIRLRESNDVRHVIEVLNGVDRPDLGVVEARVQRERSALE